MSRRTVLMVAACAVLVPIAAALSGCGGDDDPAPTTADPSALIGKTFVSDALEGTAVPGGGPLELTFPEPGRISATAGCNRHAGQVSFDGHTMTVGPLASTRMACPGERGQADAWLGEFFSGPLTWDQTALAAGDGVTEPDGILLRRGSQQVSLVERANTALTGTEWSLRSLVRNQAVETSAVIEKAGVTLHFDDGEVSGSTGCNSLSGPAAVSDRKIAFGPIVTTKTACTDEGLADVERAVLAVLAGDVTYEIDGRQLAITNVADPAIGLRLTTA